MDSQEKWSRYSDDLLKKANGDSGADDLAPLEKQLDADAAERAAAAQEKAAKKDDFEITPKMVIGGAIAVALALFGLS